MISVLSFQKFLSIRHFKLDSNMILSLIFSHNDGLNNEKKYSSITATSLVFKSFYTKTYHIIVKYK